MNKIEFVKIVYSKEPVESFILEVKKSFIINGNHFSDCETIEEIRDKFYNETSDESISFIEIYTYTTKKNMENNKPYESLCE